MTLLEIIGLVVALLVMLVGAAGSVLPALPGTPLVFVAALVHKLCFGARSIDWWVLVILGLLAAMSLVVDFLATTYGAKRLGATRRGIVGAMIGAVVGLFVFPPLGLLVMPFLGALLGELSGGRVWREAAKAGIGATLGVLAGAAGKLICCIGMVGIFLLSLLWNLFIAKPGP